MIQDPNPTDYPHLEQFTDWLYENAKALPFDVEILKQRVQSLHTINPIKEEQADGERWFDMSVIDQNDEMMLFSSENSLILAVVKLLIEADLLAVSHIGK